MKRLIQLMAGAAVVVASVWGCVYGRPAYRQYKEARGLRQARTFLTARELANAYLAARQVLQLNPRNVEACGMIAELAEHSHSPAAIDWRHRVVEIAPTVGNKLQLASCVLRFQRPPYPLAAQILHELEPEARGLAAFHVMSAELALKLNQPHEAVTHFEHAARLEPNNQLHRLNLAVLGLQSTNRAAVGDARATLEQLSTNCDLGLLALRWLVVESLRRSDLPGAERLSCRLLADPRAQLEDRLQRLEVLQRSHSPAFTSYLAAVQAGAVTNTVDLYSTSEWMASHGLSEDALKWLAGFEPKLRAAQPMPLALANLYLAKMDWAGLEAFLGGQKWAELEFLRLALLARAAWGQNQNVAGAARWRSAARAADGLGPLTLLQGLAADWGRDPEDLLWQIGRRFPRERWAISELERLYLAAGNTRGLNSVYTMLAGAKSDATDPTNCNNFATTSLLLQVNLPQAHEIALNLYRQTPDDPVIASTYAYSLHLQGHTLDGLAVLDRFPPETLAAPPLALYYGVLLAQSGDRDRAARYLSVAQAMRLLPEEKELLQEAREKSETQKPRRTATKSETNPNIK